MTRSPHSDAPQSPASLCSRVLVPLSCPKAKGKQRVGHQPAMSTLHVRCGPKLNELKLEASDERNLRLGASPSARWVVTAPACSPARLKSRRGPLRLGLRHWPAAEEGGGIMRYTGSCRGGGSRGSRVTVAKSASAVFSCAVMSRACAEERRVQWRERT